SLCHRIDAKQSFCPRLAMTPTAPGSARKPGGASPAPTPCYTRGGRRKNRGSAKIWVAHPAGFRVRVLGVWRSNIASQKSVARRRLSRAGQATPLQCHTREAGGRKTEATQKNGWRARCGFHGAGFGV